MKDFAANDNLLKSEGKAKEILQRVEKAQANMIQEIKDEAELKSGKHM